MLFEFNDFVLNNQDDLDEIKLYDALEGLSKGNLYPSLYDEYKNYKPKKLTANNERDAHMLKLMMLDFAINDLNLKLALEPNNKYLYESFTKYSLAYLRTLEEYEKKYQVLEVCHDTFGKYTFNSNPWPWEGEYV